ncbi:hypothetical protein D3C86_2262570 [compost metagenome]
MYFQLLTHTGNRWAGTNVGNAGQKRIAKPADFNRIHPFHRGYLTTQRYVRRRETYGAP